MGHRGSRRPASETKTCNSFTLPHGCPESTSNARNEQNVAQILPSTTHAQHCSTTRGAPGSLRQGRVGMRLEHPLRVVRSKGLPDMPSVWAGSITIPGPRWCSTLQRTTKRRAKVSCQGGRLRRLRGFWGVRRRRQSHASQENDHTSSQTKFTETVSCVGADGQCPKLSTGASGGTSQDGKDGKSFQKRENFQKEIPKNFQKNFQKIFRKNSKKLHSVHRVGYKRVPWGGRITTHQRRTHTFHTNGSLLFQDLHARDHKVDGATKATELHLRLPFMQQTFAQGAVQEGRPATTT